jgi:hypothetical protein
MKRGGKTIENNIFISSCFNFIRMPLVKDSRTSLLKSGSSNFENPKRFVASSYLCSC